MGFKNLPLEIVWEIAAHLSSNKDLSSFARVNRQLYSVLWEFLRKKYINSRNRAGLTPLAQASTSEDQGEVTTLLRERADVNLPDSLGRTPLSWASGFGHKDIVLRLLKSGAETNNTDGFGRTALSWAAENGHDKVVSLLLDYGATAQIGRPVNLRILKNAARQWHPNVSLQSRRRILTSQDALYELLKLEPLCWTDPLILAVTNGHKRTIEILEKYQSEISVLDMLEGSLAGNS